MKRGRPLDPACTRQSVLRALRRRGRAQLLIAPAVGEDDYDAAERARDQLRAAARSAGITVTTRRHGSYVTAQVIYRQPVLGLLRSAAAVAA